MELVPLSPHFGAEVRGVSLMDVATSDACHRAVREAFEGHSLLLFRDQQISDDVQAAFSCAFGPLERVKIGSEGVGTFYNRLHNLAPDGSLTPETHRQALTARANQLWHTDSSFKSTPALASVLSARVVPQHGGETEFASTRHAWAHLA
jgi:alpha-ketoglutarate-dependent 2,4-dichlorophenoxyacetate dioxygenase